MNEATRPRAFSGIQPSGALHLGNYLGAIRNWVRMQATTDGVYCIVDLHALSVPQPPGTIRQATIDLAADLLAIGIDPEESILFVQSQVPEHTELAWHLQCVAAFGELRRMTQFKDKSERADFVSAGLFTYPTLQAADIALYDTDVVPVGDDQRQHVEFTRDIVTRFNNRFGDVLVVPEHRIPTAGDRIMDLQAPESKMSKSTDSPQGIVYLTDPPADIEKKLKRAVTDNDAEVAFDPTGKPGVSNLLTILAVATDSDPDTVAKGYSQYGPLKTDAAEALIEMLRPFQERRAELDEPTTIELLHAGADKARERATVVMDRVRAAVNLLA
ncbi:MAG: tryptophan--tRNA ligase [Acidimicrobiia bacterium]|nr:tryptophan--tRNA ligase [Acidimicrobiia bacterium]